ncbi:MAG TPA: SRPBCC family protein [Candidatus Dormibacteraeota bacterium]|nr:SRPBCC family protein [Candidatus Dormibacteraeota bacterium]
MLGELEPVSDRWQLRFERKLKHPPAKVWAALTQPDELRKWFPDTIVVSEWRVGARLQFRHEGGLYAFDGEVLVHEPPRVLEFGWGTDRIRFEVAPAANGSVLTLIDTIDDVGKAARDAAGWHVCLDALEAALDGRESRSMGDAWPAINRDYITKFGPEAATIGPPQGAV